MQLTPEQITVINAPVSDLLVSAAAGSGKTAVMTERIVRRIVAGQLAITDVLVMTFTEAAARQMKEKIAGKLDQERRASPDPALRLRLSRQQTLLSGCAISTIHAFCLTVIRNFSHLAVDAQGQLLVEPGFSVSDPLVADLLLRETLDEVLASRYESIDRQPEDRLEPWAVDFYRLVDSFSTSRSDDKLRLQVIRLYQYLRSMPDYQSHIELFRNELSAAAQDFSHSPHADVLRDQLRVLLGQACAAIPELLDWLDNGVVLIKDPTRNQAYHVQFRRIAAVLQAIDRELANGQADWNLIVDLANSLGQLELPSLGGRGRDSDKAQLIQLFRSNLAESIHCLTGQCHTKTYRSHFLFDTQCLFNRRAETIEQEITEMLPVIGQLFDLVLQLDSLYRDRKREQGLVDFSDFEHLALQILRQPEAADYYRAHFQEIYIDEYQDTSSIQEAILQAIGQNNIFMVGDVKQSIYRFRHARPRIFISRASRYREARSGQLQTLNRNFRSVSGILEAVNEVFSQLMSVKAGEIHYDETQALVPHRDELQTQPPVELILIDPTIASGPQSQEELPASNADLDTDDGSASEPDLGDNGNPDELGKLREIFTASAPDTGEPAIDTAELNRYEQEAIITRLKIQQLLQAGRQPNDIVILARTRAIVRIFAAELSSVNIATIEDSGKTLLDSPEMRLMNALLQVMDNPLQDIPLAAVMRSVLCEGGFPPQALFEIRTAANQQNAGCRYFHEAVAWYALNGPNPELRDQVNRFRNWLEFWRAKEKNLKIGEWLNLLLETCGYFGQVAAAANGAAKLKELRAFVDWIYAFEKNRRRGLFDLVRHLENLENNGIAEAPFDFERSEQAAVRVMTIHRSKGLEFPCVFVVGLSATITPKDQQDALMINESLGVGFDWIDPDHHLRRMTHLKLAMLAENKAAALAEELRLLYVAMTRARDRLFLTAILPKQGSQALIDRLDQARNWAGHNLPPHLVLSGRSYLDWLILALARHPALDWSALAEVGPDTSPGTSDTLATPDHILDLPTQQAWSLQINRFADWVVQLTPQILPESGVGFGPGPAKTTGPDHREPSSSLQAAQQLCMLLHPLPAEDQRLIETAQPHEETAQPLIDTAQRHDETAQRLIDTAQRRISGAYPYDSAARSPIKLSVSELKRLEQHEARFGDEQAIGLPSPAHGINLDLRPLQAPDPVSAPIQGADLGTLLHSFLRYLDLPSAQAAGAAAELDRQLAVLVGAGVFSDREGEAIRNHLEDVLAFVTSDLATRMVTADIHRRQLYREMPFTLALQASTVWPEETSFAPDDRALVQGIIDCWFQEDGAAVLVDYKTDQIGSDPSRCRATLAGRYSRQLQYYAQAIEAATRLPVHEQIIVHLPSRQIISWTPAELAAEAVR